LESFTVWYTTEDSFIIGVACGKKWEGFRSLKTSEFEKWGLEPSNRTEVYAYVHNFLVIWQADKRTK